MKVAALVLVLAVAAYGQQQDPQRQPKAPLFFNPLLNPLTLTFYSTVRAISTVTAACYTWDPANAANSCNTPTGRSLRENIVPTVVESVESTAAPVDHIRESRAAQFDPLDAFFLPPQVLRAYYSPYIRGSLGADPVDSVQQRFFLPNIAYSAVTLFTNTVTSTTPITLPCSTAVNPCPANLPPFGG